ncbi:MAG: carbohydrate ABC transporter substrate-binding protein [Acidimicrobiales bacterium]|nr:carbohydrate ABC transporter substrate-binding protein [Acidimicrobiales bacterium]
MSRLAVVACLVLSAAACTVEPSRFDAALGVGTAEVRNAEPSATTIAVPQLILNPQIRIPQFSDSSFDPQQPALDQLDSVPGASVTVFGPEVSGGAESLTFAFRRFTAATGIEVDYVGAVNSDELVDEMIEAGSAPDVVITAHPNRLQDLAGRGDLVPLPRLIRRQLAAGFDPFWSSLVSLNNRTYGVPISATVTSLVWYSPREFEARGYEIPQRLAELEALVERIKADGLTPWCIGLAAGEKSGWPATDWIEDYMIRIEGPAFYDSWVNHQVPFNDERVVSVVNRVGDMWFAPGNVYRRNAINTISFTEAAQNHVDGKCVMHRQRSSIAITYRADGANLGAGLDLSAFHFPVVDEGFGNVVVGTGTFASALSSDRATMTLLAYMAAPDFANNRILAGSGAYLSAHQLHNLDLYGTTIDREMAAILVSANPFRFDGSELMPAQIGSDVFLRASVGFAGGTIDAYEFLDEIEASWPD